MAGHRYAIAALFLLLLPAVVCFPATGEVPHTYHIDRLDVTIFISAKGTLRVLEKVQFNFTSGNFSMAYRTIPHSGFDMMDSATVYNSTNDIIKTGYAYRFDQFHGKYEIRWTYDPVLGPANATFTVDYEISGAVVEVSRDQDALDWYAVGSGWGVPIGQANITVILPLNCSGSSLLQTAPATMERQFDARATYLYQNMSGIPARSPVRVIIHYPKTTELQVTWQKSLRENWFVIAMLIFGITLAIFTANSLLRFVAARLPPRAPRPDKRLQLQPAKLATMLAGKYFAGALLASATALAGKGAVRMVHDTSSGDLLFETREPPEPLDAHDAILLSALAEEGSARGLAAIWPRLRLELQGRCRAELRSEGRVLRGGRLSWVSLVAGSSAMLVAGISLGVLIYTDQWNAVLYGGLLLGICLAGAAVFVVGGFLTPNRTLRGARETAAQRAFIDDMTTRLEGTAASKPAEISAQLLGLLPLLLAARSGRPDRFPQTLRRICSAGPQAPLDVPWYNYQEPSLAGDMTLGRFGKTFSQTAQELPEMLAASPEPAEEPADSGLYTGKGSGAAVPDEKGGGKD